MFKVGTKVRLISNHSSWGDTEIGVRDGYLIVGKVYKIHSTTVEQPRDSHGQGVQLLGERKPWWVGLDCLEPYSESKKPSWM